MNLNKRLWKLDTIKGIAIILVIIYHAIFDLSCFTTLNIDCNTWLWNMTARMAASLFILSSGISSALSINNSRQKNSYKRMYLRAAKLFGIALAITLTTTIFFEEGAIVFGILHFLAVASIISIPFYTFGVYNLLIASAIFLASFFIEHIPTSSFYFIWLGVTPPNFSTLDYFPLIPWFSLYLIGLSLGKYFDINAKHLTPPQPQSNSLKFLCFLGSHTLLLYLAHQPIFFALGYFLFR